jgi:hypothetical protein
MSSLPNAGTNPAPKKSSRLLKSFRKLHTQIASVLFVFFFISSCTGVLLGWKKHSGGLILPKTHKGVSSDLKTWLPIDSLHTIALQTLRDSISPDISPELERIDARPQKGMVKFVFIEHFWGIQLDATTGRVLHIERRNSDIIENIHDGSIVDYFLETGDEQFKLVYTTVMGSSLFLLTLTGFWMWYGPKRQQSIRKRDAAAR